MPDINKAYSWAVSTCNSPNVGYDQAYRLQKTVGGITYYDCSSFIYYALQSGGFENIGLPAFTTLTMIPVLLSSGFTEIDITGEWKPGDIVWRSGHCEMVYEGDIGKGRTMGAHSPKEGVSIRNFWATYTGKYAYTRIFRYGEGGASDLGLSIYVICGILGNFWYESHVNPGQGEIGGGGGFGLGQWTGGRRTSLENYLREHGYELSDGIGQLNYLLVEEDVWLNKFGNFPTMDEYLHSSSTDIDFLVEAWMRNWENPRESTANLQERIQFAHRYYEYIQAHAQDSTIKDWIIRSTLLSADESDNNAVLVYRFLNVGGGGGGGEPGKKKHTMPVWMMCKYW